MFVRSGFNFGCILGLFRKRLRWGLFKTVGIRSGVGVWALFLFYFVGIFLCSRGWELGFRGVWVRGGL